MNKNKIQSLLIASVSLITILMFLLGLGRDLELKTVDWRFVLRGENPLSDKVLLIAIGDESVSPDAFGRWPWRRSYMATLIDILSKYPPRELIFDMLFTEPSQDFPGDDVLFSDQAARLNNVYFPFYCIPKKLGEVKGYKDDIEDVNKKLIKTISLANSSEFPAKMFIDVQNIVMPIPILSRSSVGSGYVNAAADTDGVTRRIPLVMKYKEFIVPNVAFYAALNYLGVENDDVEIRPGKYIKFTAKGKKIKIPVDNKCRMLVNHPGAFSQKYLKIASFVEIFKSYFAMEEGSTPVFDLNQVRDKLVFLGLTATGTHDLRPTPFSTVFPMVAFLGATASNIIENEFLRPVPAILDILLIIISIILTSFLTLRFKALKAAVLNILYLGVYFLASYAIFKSNIVIATFYPFLGVILSYTVITLYRFTGEEKEKKAIRGMFQRYVSSSVVDVILDNPEQIKLGGERKRLSIFFSDIRGFTAMSEKLTPEEVVHILNEYLTEMIDIIFKYNGTLDKFMGDAVMAFWGAPAAQEKHAELAVRAAWDMKKKVEELQEKWEKEGLRKFGIGIGVNTGDAVVGNMGSSEFADYTIIGDNVNLAARLEQNAHSGQLILSASTYEEVKDFVIVEKMRPMRVKGKEKPLEVYEVKGLKG
ncbi:CHASE2 domain-containing protein [Elusimicrobiota bacterium]